MVACVRKTDNRITRAFLPYFGLFDYLARCLARCIVFGSKNFFAISNLWEFLHYHRDYNLGSRATMTERKITDAVSTPTSRPMLNNHVEVAC